MQTWLSGDDGEGLGLGSFLEFFTEEDGFGEELEDDDTVSADSAEGANGIRLKTLYPNPKAAKPPPIPINSNLLGKAAAEAETDLGCEFATLDGKFIGETGSIGRIVGIGVYSGST